MCFSACTSFAREFQLFNHLHTESILGNTLSDERGERQACRLGTMSTGDLRKQPCTDGKESLQERLKELGSQHRRHGWHLHPGAVRNARARSGRGRERPVQGDSDGQQHGARRRRILGRAPRSQVKLRCTVLRKPVQIAHFQYLNS